MKIRTPFALGLFPTLLLLVGATESKPNVVIMMVDDMGFAGPSIAPYGNPHYKTPGMDRLAREGMLFTDFHSSGTVCSSTRAGLLTGRYQQRVGIEAVIHPRSDHPEHRKGLQKSEITFAELFKEAGYATGLVGKWHLGYAGENPNYHPQNHGFDYFMGYHSGNVDYINHWGDHMKHDWWHGRKETPEKGYTTHLINKYALEFLEQNKDKPFCLYVAHESPHSPVQGPNDPIQRGPGARKRTTPYAEAMKQMILEMDKGVEQVRAKLVELGLEKNTLFLFFSDNGDAPRTNTGHPSHRGHKGSVYEGGTRVPAIAWWPGRIKPGTSTDALSITLDVMPTILSVAGIEKPKNRALDGVDLSPVLFEQKTLPARPLYWGSLSNNGARSEALRDGNWKLVVQHPKAKPGTFANERIELFRLDKDLGEEDNLAEKEPKRAAAMFKQLKAWYAETQETATYQPGGWVPRPQSDVSFFNGKDLTGWSASEMKYWSVKDGAVMGHSAVKVPGNKFIWADGEVEDFYLTVEVKLTPDNRNAGIQFRSKKANASGQAFGYQADVGGGVWGKLYHEHGRGKLDWNNNAVGAVKPGEWNRYEILAVGHKIWTAINGKLCVALEDPKGELSGKISFQVHGGPAQTVLYRNPTLVHNPKIALEKQTEKQLLAALPKKKVEAPKPAPAKPISTPLPRWTKLIMAEDPGSRGEVWAKPELDHSKWKTMKVPGHFEKAGLPGHDGVVWFRKTIELSAEQAKAKAVLYLGQIDDMDVTWVNGVRVGGYENPGHHYTVRKYPVPAGLLKAGKNTIAVRVMDHGAPGGIAGKPEQLALQLGKERLSLANLWSFAPGANLKALNKQATLIGPKPGWNAEVTAWRAKLDANDPGMTGKWYASEFDDSKWKIMKLPKHYETAGLPGHDGTVWFRRAIDVHVGRGGKPIGLQLGAIDDMDMTFFNGHFLGGTETPGFWTKQRVYKVPGEWVKEGRNVITVRVIDHGWSGGMNGPASSMKWVNSENVPNLLSGDWSYHPGVTLKALGLGPLTNPNDQPKVAEPTVSVEPPEPALLHPLNKPSDAVSAFAEGFALQEDATIVILGGSNAAETQRFGYLETLLAAAHPERRLIVRNMAWPADTVFNQQRPRNFFAAIKPSYGEKDRRIKTAVDVAVLWLGQAEALGQSEQVEEFASAYEETLEQLGLYTERIVLVTPVPFEDPLGLGLDLQARNVNLGKHAATIRRLAKKRDLPIVDLFRALNGKKATSDGQRLSRHGHWLAAQAFAKQLGYAEPVAKIKHALSGGLQPAGAEELRLAIRAKDVMWRQFWVPPNWAFLYGNRQTQPSSRSHTDRGYRWFPEEIQTIPSKLVDLDRAIYDRVRKK